MKPDKKIGSDIKKPVVGKASRENGTSGINSRLAATLLLTRVIDDHRNLDALCDKQNGIRQFLALSDIDRGLSKAIAMTALRHRKQIEATLKQLMSRSPPQKARFLIHSLHVAAAQILFMDVPESAAVNVAVSAIKNDKRTTRFSSLANAVLRRMAREAPELRKRLATVSPFPDWFSKKLRSDYGKQNAERIADSFSETSYLDISVKSKSEYWAKALNGDVLPNGSVRIKTSTPVPELEGYHEGEWWVQDAAATFPAQMITAETGANVLELCAAPGGKTAQLCNFGYNVTALDISETRLRRLQDNLDRLKFNATTVCADILEWKPHELFDAVLIDAPCSSTGTIRRHPDVLWAKTAEDIDLLAEVQFKLLQSAAEFLKPGGTLVFANCSMLKQEGEDLLARTLKSNPKLQASPLTPSDVSDCAQLINRQGALRSLPYHALTSGEPDTVGLDGFFACRFIRA